jgi:hypothetical protein
MEPKKVHHKQRQVLIYYRKLNARVLHLIFIEDDILFLMVSFGLVPKSFDNL